MQHTNCTCPNCCPSKWAMNLDTNGNVIISGSLRLVDDDEYERLKEENEKLKKLNAELLGNPALATEWDNLVAQKNNLKDENKQLHFDNAMLTRENKKLKDANKQLLSDYEKLCEETIDLDLHEKMMKEYHEKIKQAEEDNAKLKAQLQNRDKESQVERKPHKCPVCNGSGRSSTVPNLTPCNSILVYLPNPNGDAYLPCHTCGGGIIWEPK